MVRSRLPPAPRALGDEDHDRRGRKEGAGHQDRRRRIVLALLALVCSLAVAAETPPQADAPQSAIVSGRVLDADSGRPIPGALVTAYGSAAASVTARILTNQGGFFVVRGLRRGSLALTAVKSGYVDAAYGQQRPAGGLQMIAIDDGQRLVDLDIRIWKQGALTGTLLDETGDPVIGARVRAFRQI